MPFHAALCFLSKIQQYHVHDAKDQVPQVPVCTCFCTRLLVLFKVDCPLSVPMFLPPYKLRPYCRSECDIAKKYTAWCTAQAALHKQLLTLCQGISGVLVRLTTCKRLTNNSLPKLSLITLFPSEAAGYQVGRIYGRTCQYPSGFIPWGYQGKFFSSLVWGKSEKFIIVDGGDRTHNPNTHGLSTTP